MKSTQEVVYQNGSPTVVVTRHSRGEDMNLEELLSFIIVSIQTIGLQCPAPFSKPLLTMVHALADLTERLDAKGVLKKDEIIEMVKKRVEESIKDIEEKAKGEVGELAAQVARHIQNQTKTAKQN